MFDITPDSLAEKNIDLLLLDLDNTLAPYSELNPSEEVRAWVRLLTEAGIKLYIVSNNRGDRPERFARLLGIGYIKSARKPFTAETRKLLDELGVGIDRTALAGDQIFTDMLCANKLGVVSIVVTPVDMKNPLILMRYLLERPFRWAYERRRKRFGKN